MILGKKKEDLGERLDKLIDRLRDVSLNVKFYKKKYEKQIKRYLAKGKTPPPALLAAWKISSVLLDTIESSIISLESAKMVNEVGSAIQEAVGATSLDKLADTLREINQNLANIGVVLRQMVMVQNQLVNATQSISMDVSSLMNEIAESTEQLMPEVMEDIGAEFLEELKVSDPELYEKIPEEIKKKYIQSSSEE